MRRVAACEAADASAYAFDRRLPRASTKEQSCADNQIGPLVGASTGARVHITNAELIAGARNALDGAVLGVFDQTGEV